MKRLIAAISALVIFLGYAFLYESKQETKQEKPTVAILQLMTHPAHDSIHHGIVDALKENGYVPGKTIRLDYQNAEGDQSSLKTMSDRFKNENSAVMIGIATPAAQSLANVANGKTPVVMGAISDPIGAGLVRNIKHPGANITGVIHREPVKQQVKLIKTIMPNVKVIGGLHTSSDDSSTAEFKEFKQLAEKEGVKVKDYTITSTNDIDQVSSTMASEVEAVYIPTDNTVASGFSTVVKNTDAKKIPVFPSVTTMIKQGGIATVSVSQYELGKLTGQMAAEILDGKKPGNMALRYVKLGQTHINLKHAEELGLDVPKTALKQAQKKGSIIK